MAATQARHVFGMLVCIASLLLPEAKANGLAVAQVATAWDLFVAVRDLQVSHIKVLNDIDLGELLSAPAGSQDTQAPSLNNSGGGTVPYPSELISDDQEQAAVVPEPSMFLASTRALPYYSEVLAGYPPEALTPSNFSWAAWRHTEIQSWTQPITRTLFIEGTCNSLTSAHCVLHGSNLNRLFAVVSRGNVTFSFLKFTGGRTVSLDENTKGITSEDKGVEHIGSAVLVASLGTAVFRNCVFDSNHASSSEGSPASTEWGSGGAIGLMDVTRVLLESCDFMNNSAAEGPTDITSALHSTVVINKCTFLPSSGPKMSYAVMVHQDLGSIFQARLSIYNTKFAGDPSMTGGGLLVSGETVARLVQVEFVGLTAQDGDTLAPLVVTQQAQAYLSSISFLNCTNSSPMGASALLVTKNSAVELQQSNVFNNEGGPAAVVVSGSRMNIMHTSFTGNLGSANGSSVASTASVLQIWNSTFTDGRAEQGGCMWVTGGVSYVWSSTFSHCRANGHGGAVMIDNRRETTTTTSAVFYDTTIQHSHAALAGGGILSTDRLDLSSPKPGTFIEERVYLVLTDVLLLNNSVGGFGGAMLVTASSVFLESVAFVNNTAGVAGPEIWMRFSTMIVGDSESDMVDDMCELANYGSNSAFLKSEGADGLTDCAADSDNLISCSPLSCLVTERPTWPTGTTCAVSEADYLLEAGLQCGLYSSLLGVTMTISHASPPFACGSIRCSVDDVLQADSCTKGCEDIQEQPLPFLDKAIPQPGDCPDGSASGFYDFQPLQPPLHLMQPLNQEPEAELTSNVTVPLPVESGSSLKIVSTGVVATVAPPLGQDGTAAIAYHYGNFQGANGSCGSSSSSTSVCDFATETGSFVQALDSSGGSSWELIISAHGSASVFATSAASDANGVLQLLLSYQPEHNSTVEGNEQISLLVRTILPTELDSTVDATLPLSLPPGQARCIGLTATPGLQGAASGQLRMQVKVAFAIGVDGAMECTDLETRSTAGLLGVTGTFQGLLSTGSGQLVSSIAGTKTSGFVVLLQPSQDAPVPLRPQLAITVDVAGEDSAVALTGISVDSERNEITVIGTIQGYLAPGVGNPIAHQPQQTVFVRRYAIALDGTQAQELWTRDLGFPGQSSWAGSLVAADQGLLFGGSYSSAGLPSQYMAGSMSLTGDIQWLQQGNMASSSWVQDMAVDIAGGSVHMAVNTQLVNGLPTSSVLAMTLCLSTGSLLNITAVESSTAAQVSTAEPVLATGLALAPAGASCTQSNCGLLVSSNAFVVDMADVSQSQQVPPQANNIAAVASQATALVSMAVIQTTDDTGTEVPWLFVALIFGVAVCCATLVAICCFWCIFYGPAAKPLGIESHHGKNSLDGSQRESSADFEGYVGRIDQAEGRGNEWRGPISLVKLQDGQDLVQAEHPLAVYYASVSRGSSTTPSLTKHDMATPCSSRQHMDSLQEIESQGGPSRRPPRLQIPENITPKAGDGRSLSRVLMEGRITSPQQSTSAPTSPHGLSRFSLRNPSSKSMNAQDLASAQLDGVFLQVMGSTESEPSLRNFGFDISVDETAMTWSQRSVPHTLMLSRGAGMSSLETKQGRRSQSIGDGKQLKSVERRGRLEAEPTWPSMDPF